MHSVRFVVPALAGLLCWSTASTALAKPEATQLEGSKPRFYLYGSPLFFGVPFGDDDFEDFVDISYQWGFGLGGLFALGSKKNFGLGIGFGFEHNPFTVDEDFEDFCDFGDCGVHALRFLPELRLGYLWQQLFAYGYVSPGFSVATLRYDRPFDQGDEFDADPGFNFGLGGGVQYVVWKGLFVGGEIGFDLGAFTDDEADQFEDDDYGIFIFDFRALIGYYF
jgi:hypothetical protein